MFTKAMRMLALAGAVAMLGLSAHVAAGEAVAKRLGYVGANRNHEFQKYLTEGVRAAVKARDARLLIMDAGDDADVQVQQVESMLLSGVDAVMVVAVDVGRVHRMVAAARLAGVPLVFVNRNPWEGRRPPDNCYYVGTDAMTEGEMQMAYAGSRIGALDGVLVLQGTLSQEPAKRRVDGVRQVISSSYPELAWLAVTPADWERAPAREITEEWLKEYGSGKIKAIIAGNDMMALGALDALDAAGLGGVVVVGVDALPEALEAVREGRLAATVSQDPGMQAKAAVDTALDAAAGRMRTQQVILPSELITADTVDRYTVSVENRERRNEG